ncbi:MAG: hypothetical protein AAB434_06005 [Planctomycetota bacterium]
MRLPLLAPLCLSLCLLAEEPKPLPEGVSLEIVVQEVQGEVDVRPSAKDKWVAATKGMKLAPGAKVCTGVTSGVAISFGTNSVALVSECTVCNIKTFEMRGEELVAGIHLEPGIAKVTVKQLEQFHTDFQVSTPRLTCSVKGSEGIFESTCDEHQDRAECTNDRVEVNGEEIVQGEETNSDGETNVEIATTENLVDPVDGESEQEAEDENLQANLAGGIDLNSGDTGTDTGGGPSGADPGTDLDVPPPDGCDPAQIAADEQFLTDHGLNELVFFLQTGDAGHLTQAQDDFDTINFSQNEDPIFQEKRAAILRLIECSAFGTQLQDNQGLNFPAEHALLHALIAEAHLDTHLEQGIDLSQEEQDHADLTMLHNVAHHDGLAAFVSQGTNEIKGDFFGNLDANTGLTQGERDARIADYTTEPIVGDTAFQTTLNQLVQESSNGAPGGYDAQAYGEALVALLHLGAHVNLASSLPGNSPGSYDFDHPGLHSNLIDPLLQTLGQDGVHVMVQEKADLIHQAWHDQTRIPEGVQDGETGFEAHQALHEAKDQFLDAGAQGANASNEPQ